ncbi:MAG: sulfotransferase family protein [Phycisphaeraceae bacterium]
MMRPNFLVIGAARCGTSSLCARLASHPDIFISDPKEPFFFSHDELYQRGFAWYESHFRNAGTAKAVGEGSTTYTKHAQFPHVAERIARDLPHARLIYVVRHPLDQIASHYMVLRSHAENAIRHGAAVGPLFADSVRQNPVLVDTALYWKQINRYRRHFPDRQILVVFFEDYRDAPDRTLRAMLEFLNVDLDVPLEETAGARHASSALLEDRTFLRPFQGSSIVNALRRHTPETAKNWVRPFVKRRIGERPTWDEPTRQWTIERVRPDAEQFLASYGRPGLWRFD